MIVRAIVIPLTDENPIKLGLTKNSDGDIINVILTEENNFHLLFEWLHNLATFH